MSALPGDTIAAISTPPGPGGVALVRLSGPRAMEIADAVFRGARPLSACPTHTVHHGGVYDAAGCEADEVLATVLRAPTSYTTEDMVEFGCHGGAMPSRRVLDACLEAGARLARRGEFTERAFLGGRIDLVQAEAVADVIAAQTREGLAVALGQLEGGLSGRLAELRQTLLDYRAEVEALIDFSDEDIEPATTDAIAALGERAAGLARELLATADYGVAVRDGVSVAIIGRPNVGKSTIMNALLRRDRAIVTDEPGTTRDAIEETMSLDGVPVRLIDTAGWRETQSAAEAEGVKRAKAAASGADVIVHVIDASVGVTAEDESIAHELDDTRAVTVANKQDLVESRGDRASTMLGAANTVWTSARTGEGLDELERTLARVIVPPHGDGSGARRDAERVQVSNARHVNALRRVTTSIARSLELLRDGASADIVAQEIADATDALGDITGETAPEDVLRRVFEKFCIGK